MPQEKGWIADKMIDFRELQGKGNFYFLRHGESRGNIDCIIQGRREYPLSETGIKQAREAGKWFAPKDIELILTSPLSRAKATAEIVAAEAGIAEIELCDQLTELDTGIFTGLQWRDIPDKHPEQWSLFQKESWESVPQAETMADLLERTAAFWQFVKSLHRRGRRNILSVTHSGTLQGIIKSTLNYREWMPLIPIANCGICHFSLDNTRNNHQSVYNCQWEMLNYQLLIS